MRTTGRAVARSALTMFVAALLWPVAAGASPVSGTGVVTGTVTYNQGFGPLFGATRCSGPFTLSGHEDELAATADQAGWLEDFTFSGSGQTNCESPMLGSGDTTLSLESDELSCPNLDGTYIRVGLRMNWGWNGQCMQGPSVSVSLDIVLVPTQGDWVTTPVTEAEFNGLLTVTPD